MTLYDSLMTSRGKCEPGCTCGKHTSYKRTPEHLAAQSERLRGIPKTAEEIAKRTATRKAKGTLVTHGHGGVKERTPTYFTWMNMIQRCTNPNNTGYKYYGARGITVCERWRRFENFLADMGERPEGLTLDRIDNNGNYEPGNCRWTDKETQTANRRRSAYYDRPSRTPECGHPERPHKARGMCNSCYVTDSGRRRK